MHSQGVQERSRWNSGTMTLSVVAYKIDAIQTGARRDEHARAEQSPGEPETQFQQLVTAGDVALPHDGRDHPPADDDHDERVEASWANIIGPFLTISPG